MEQICIDKGLSEFGCSCITWGLYFYYFLGGIALLVLIVLPLRNALQAPKEMLKSAIGIGVLLAAFVVAYVISSPEVTPKMVSLGTTDSQLIGAGLILFYIALVASVIGLIYSEIKKALL